MLVQECEDMTAFTFTQFIDVAGKTAVDVNHFTPGNGVLPDNRMDGPRIPGVRIKPSEGQHAVVGGGQSLQVLLHAVRQRVVSRIHAGEDRIAPHGRQRMQVENAAHGRHFGAGHIGMPLFSRYMLGGLVRVKSAYFRMLGKSLKRMFLQRSEVQSDPLQRGGIQRLLAKEDHQVRSQRIVQVFKLGIIQRLRQVDARYDCPDPGCQGATLIV